MSTYGKVFLSGSLTTNNVSEAIRIAHPYAVDVASSIENEPGKKDHQKMKDFLTVVKAEDQIDVTR
jgi:phosphoribosylanthranilate isomerase